MKNQNQSNNPDFRLLQLSLEAGDRGLLEWLEVVLTEEARKRLPTIQID